MKVDLKHLNRKELTKLSSDIAKALAKLNQKELKAARDEAAKIAAKHGFTLDDIAGGPAKAVKATKKPKAKGPIAAPKFANPADKSQTWTGKGRQPEWYKSAISAGKSPDDLAI